MKEQYRLVECVTDVDRIQRVSGAVFTFMPNPEYGGRRVCRVFGSERIRYFERFPETYQFAEDLESVEFAKRIKEAIDLSPELRAAIAACSVVEGLSNVVSQGNNSETNADVPEVSDGDSAVTPKKRGRPSTKK